MQPCRFCAQPVPPGFYDSVPAHVSCTLAWLDAGNKERLSRLPVEKPPPTPVTRRKKKEADLCDVCGIRCVCHLRRSG